MDDVAKKVGVSKGTVSKALSGAADVSEAMRNSILEAAVELGYSRISRASNKKRLCIFVENMTYESPEDFGWELITGSFVTHVGINNNEGMELTISRLKELGHRKIGYLSGALGAYIYQERYKAFFQALRQNQLDDDRALAGVSYYTSECLERHLPRLLEKNCTAIICSYDLLAHSVMIHCTELGLKIPTDLSIVGFDDIPLCRYTTPPLSSVRQDRTNLGKSAFFALASQFRQVPISTLQLHAELIQRGSMGTAPVKQSEDIEQLE